MFRRNFLQLMTVATAGGFAPLHSLGSTGGKVLTYRVKGFSCVTCATGLDTMLIQQRGIISSKSTYPEGIVTVKFDPDRIPENAIVGFISDLGFRVEDEASRSASAQTKGK